MVIPGVYRASLEDFQPGNQIPALEKKLLNHILDFSLNEYLRSSWLDFDVQDPRQEKPVPAKLEPSKLELRKTWTEQKLG